MPVCQRHGGKVGLRCQCGDDQGPACPCKDADHQRRYAGKDVGAPHHLIQHRQVAPADRLADKRFGGMRIAVEPEADQAEHHQHQLCRGQRQITDRRGVVQQHRLAEKDQHGADHDVAADDEKPSESCRIEPCRPEPEHAACNARKKITPLPADQQQRQDKAGPLRRHRG